MTPAGDDGPVLGLYDPQSDPTVCAVRPLSALSRQGLLQRWMRSPVLFFICLAAAMWILYRHRRSAFLQRPPLGPSMLPGSSVPPRGGLCHRHGRGRCAAGDYY